MRKEKQLLLDDIKSKINTAPALVVMSYQAMNPNLASDFRGEIIENGGCFTVMSKRLLMKAAQEAGITIGREVLQGHIGVVFAGEDAVAATKVIYKYKDQNKNLIDVLAGQFEGKMCSPQEVEQISKLPSRDQLRAEFLGLLEAPMSQTLAVVEALLCSVPHCLENKSAKEE